MQCFSGLCIWKPKWHCHQCTSNQRYKWFYQNKIAWLKLTNRCLRLTDNYVTPTFHNPINFQIKSIPTPSFSFHMSHYGCKVVQMMTLKRPGLLIVIKIYFYPSHLIAEVLSSHPHRCGPVSAASLCVCPSEPSTGSSSVRPATATTRRKRGHSTEFSPETTQILETPAKINFTLRFRPKAFWTTNHTTSGSHAKCISSSVKYYLLWERLSITHISDWYWEIVRGKCQITKLPTWWRQSQSTPPLTSRSL